MATAELNEPTTLDLKSLLAMQDGLCADCEREIKPGERIAKPAESCRVVCLSCYIKSGE